MQLTEEKEFVNYEEVEKLRYGRRKSLRRTNLVVLYSGS